MINKIKDKQTGEYHDIGGLKCKLVETAKVSSVTDVMIKFKLLNKLENNKMYLIKRYDFMSGEISKSTVIVYNNGSSQISISGTTNAINDNDGSPVWAQCSYYFNSDSEGPIVIIVAYPTIPEDFVLSVVAEDDYIEIYELPFALEV